MTAASAVRGGTAAGTGLLTLQRRRYLIAFLFVLPALVNFAVFRYVPIFMAGQASLYDYSLLGGFGDFVGMKNYVRAIEDDLFWSSMWVSFQYALLKVPAQVFLALLLALFVSRAVRGMGVMRTIIFFPVVTSLVVGAMLWSMMYNRDLGLIQSMLSVFGLRHSGFLSSPDLALPSIVGMMVWKEVGFSMIIFVAGLKGIPEMFYDAAAIDGASVWRQFRSITVPLLRPVLALVLIITVVGSFQVFDTVAIATRGGPVDSSRVLQYYIYDVAFGRFQFGYASAMSVALLLVLVIITFIQYRVTRAEQSDLS